MHQVHGVDVKELGHVLNIGSVRQFDPIQTFELLVFHGGGQNLSHGSFFCVKVIFDDS